MKNFLTLTLSLLILATGTAQKTRLELNLEEGKVYKQVTNSYATVIEDVNGQKFDIFMTIRGSMTFIVTGIKSDSFVMDVSYDSLAMIMELPQGKMSFNSEKHEDTDIFSQILASMKNKPFIVTMTKGGKVAEVKNIESVFESAFDQFPQLTEAQVSQIKAQIMKAYGEKAFKGNIEMITAIFPKKPVNLGDTWDIKTNLESGMSADMFTTYEFKEQNEDYNLIYGDSKIATADKDAYIESGGMALRYDLTGTMTSKIKVDRESGWIIEAIIYQEIKGEGNVKESDQFPEGLKIPMTLTNEMTITNN